MFEESEIGNGMQAGGGGRGPGEGWGIGPQRKQRKNGWERQVVIVQIEPLSLSSSYIWQHIEIGYVQGMCDLLAPLLVILDDGECVFQPKGWGRSFLPIEGAGQG